jgi:hypothetical protein
MGHLNQEDGGCRRKTVIQSPIKILNSDFLIKNGVAEMDAIIRASSNVLIFLIIIKPIITIK